MPVDVKKLKQLLGIPLENTEQDVALEYVMDNVTEVIVNYCNVEELPTGLINTAYRMAIDIYRNENPGHEESAQGSISSISEGDTSTSFHKSIDENFKDTLLKDYAPSLKRYRRVVFR